MISVSASKKAIKTGVAIICCLLFQMLIPISVFALGSVEPPIIIFVSSSMPDNAIKSFQCQAGHIDAPLVMRGLIDSSLKKTVIWAKKWVSDDSATSEGVQINPILFRQYNIDQVPAVLVRKGNEYGVVYGNVTLDYALKYVAENNKYDSAVSEAARKALIQFKYYRGTAC